jgi:thiosulfate/3-mercaptopyruvate sulfurtransferase
LTPFQTLVSTEEAASHLDDPGWLIVDCRFTLGDAGLGRQEYLQAHIPGAVYLNLEVDLSGKIIPGETGRHPLPSIAQAAEVFSRIGISPGTQVVAYDAAGGGLAAARLWWMLRWLGHTSVAVLDGGWQAWLAEGIAVRAGVELRPPTSFIPYPNSELSVNAAFVSKISQDSTYRLLDARSTERFHGQNETIDPVAGHIPGAISAPNTDNLEQSGRFKSPAELRQIYTALLAGVPAENAVVYCGSGVTATLDILAMQIAGMGEARLYPGSWSEWITDPTRPVALD